MAKPRKCRIAEVAGELVTCNCGWHYKAPRAGEYGSAALTDLLLDRYNAHRAPEAKDAGA